MSEENNMNGNTLSDNVEGFYQKLNAITGGEQEEPNYYDDGQEGVEDSSEELNDEYNEEYNEESHDDNTDDIASKPEEHHDDDEDDDMSGKNPIPYGRWKKIVEKKNELKSTLEHEREEKMRAQIQLDNYQKAMEEFFNNKGKADNSVPASIDDDVSDQIDPLDEDTHKFTMAQIKKLTSELESLKTNYATKEDINTQRASSRFESDVSAQRAQFEKSNPDYVKALEHLQNVKHSEALMKFGDKDVAGRYAMEDILTLAASAYKSGKNVPEAIYNIAKNYGYSPKTSKPNPNIDAINSNMKRGVSDSGSRAALPMGVGNYTQPGYLKKIKGADGYTDKDQFQKILDKLQNS